ncbi:DUF308 domain-containing protein [Methanogenium organophilum]|uniref:DUF308 domain-containing protein n=1 Tax=Methanogenium organophilum TaxID=2199 RepID=A0A9X9S2E6_METOG|nr:DUF308 domain-containing protein [Methanogenium organophilum]WAI00569.1 DUF308 domain-containing protein [Methanogenium organophilum]
MEFQETEMMISGDELISAAWWVFILQGLVGIILGGLAMLFPEIVVELLAILLGIIIVLYSLSAIVQSIVSKDSGGRKILMVILGIIGIIIGILALMNMTVLGLTIAFMLGLWAFISGFSALYTAFTATEFHWYRIIFFIIGILFLVFGIYVIIYPLALTAAFIWVLGLFAFIIGIATIVLGFIMQAEMKKAMHESGM